MKILIEYDDDKEKFYFNFENRTLETIYGTYSTVERLHDFISDIDKIINIINQVQNSDFGITVEV